MCRNQCVWDRLALENIVAVTTKNTLLSEIGKYRHATFTLYSLQCLKRRISLLGQFYFSFSFQKIFSRKLECLFKKYLFAATDKLPYYMPYIYKYIKHFNNHICLPV